MAYTLVEASQYSNDVLQRGVIELFVRDDPVLEILPFITIEGNGLTYIIEKTEAGAEFYQVGDTWVESTPEVEQTTAVLRILGGDADVDNFLRKTRSNDVDLKAEAIEAKIKALRKLWMEKFYYGYNAGNPKEFDGIQKLINSGAYNTIAIGTSATAPGALSLTKLEEAVDMVKGGKPNIILMSKAMRRYINKYLRGVGGITYEDAAGKRLQTLFDIPVGVSDYISNNENCDQLIGSTYGYEPTTPIAAGDGATTILVLRCDPKACCGVQNGEITIEPLGALETKDAERFRIKWYSSVMLQSIITCSKVTGIDFDGTVGA